MHIAERVNLVWTCVFALPGSFLTGTQTGPDQQMRVVLFVRVRESGDVTDLAQDHATVYRANARNGHDDGIQRLNNICYLGFNTFQLNIQ